MSDEASTAKKKPRGRSPAYPAINLETAIQRARELWDRERQHPTPVETAVKHWGYKALSGPALGTLSALRKFGLTEDEGKSNARRTRLTDLAVEILGNPDEEARREAIKHAALNPPLHRDLWERYGDQLPSAGNLRWELIREMGFTERGADEFTPQYRDTISFAKLAYNEGSTPAPEGQDDDDSEGSTQPPGHSLRGGQSRRRRMSEAAENYAIPLGSGASVIVEGEFPITEQDWAQFLAVLTAMKPGLVQKDQNRTGE